MFVANQFMLMGLLDGEIVCEVQVTGNDITLLNLPAELPSSLRVEAPIALRVLASVGWKPPAKVEEWVVECQQLHRR